MSRRTQDTRIRAAGTFLHHRRTTQDRGRPCSPGGFLLDTLDRAGGHIAVLAGYAAGGAFVAWCTTETGGQGHGIHIVEKFRTERFWRRIAEM
ncbi:hypothetical protein GCM10010400_41590 [Streptomyces aculeolatus]